MTDFYETNDEDIEKVLNYLRIFEPRNATREYATELLKYVKLDTRLKGRFEPNELPELLAAFKKTASGHENQ